MRLVVRFAAAILALAAVVGACADDQLLSTDVPRLSGDTCALALTQATCAAHGGCEWTGPVPCGCEGSSDGGCTCPSEPQYVCQAVCSPDQGCAEDAPACVCPAGEVCYQIDDGAIGCVAPAQGDGDACARVVGEGRCDDSPIVTGLCACTG